MNTTKPKATPQRVLFEIVNFLLVLSFTVPVGAFAEQFFGYPEYRVVFLLSVACLGYILGRLTMHADTNTAMSACLVGAVAAGVIMAFTLPVRFVHGYQVAFVVMILLAVGLSVYFYFCARKAGYAIYGPLSIAGIIIHLVILLGFAGLEYSDKLLNVASYGAIVFFLLSLYAFNAKGLRRSIHAGSLKSTVSYPAGMQMSNFFLITGFVILALILSNISPLFQMFSFLFGRLIKGLISILGFVTSVFDRRSVATSYEDETATVADEDNLFNMEAVSRGERPVAATIVAIFAMACVVVLVILFLRWLFKTAFKRIGGMPKFVLKLRAMFAPPEEEDYVDETESLFTWKTLGEGALDSLKNALKKVTERPQRIDDFPDPRMKIRFAFKEVLKKLSYNDHRAIYRTPYELLATQLDDDDDYAELIETYNEVRYNDGIPTDEQVQHARKLMKQKIE